MILLLTYRKNKNDFSIQEESPVELIDTEKYFKQQMPQNSKDHEEDFSNAIVASLDKDNHKGAKLIVIDKELGTENWNRAIRLAGHIATHQFKHVSLGECPIVLTSPETPELSEFKDTPVLNIFSVEGIYFKTIEELFKQEKNDSTGLLELKANDFLRKVAKKPEWQTLNIPYNHDNRHQITNEWGAIKLALNAGFSTEDIDYDFPPTLYFKYLLKKYGAHPLPEKERKEILEGAYFDTSVLNNGKTDLSKLLDFKKDVLLIDDNANKGWKEVLDKIFHYNTIDVEEDYEKVNQFGNFKDLSHYGLIFLDLRLPKIQAKEIKLDYGLQLLERIKENNPEIPVIVFTASNKSWNYEDVMEKGGDGIYVKESPEFAGNIDDSKKNFKSFVKTVKTCLDKYKVLRPYWEKIREVKNNFLPEIKDNNPNQKFKSRIEERLAMFYGLLKRGFEQRKYNEEMFHFSDYELAFMTLWSVLNEISEAYYDKTEKTEFTLKNMNGSDIQNSVDDLTKHPNGTSITKIPFSEIEKDWKIKGQNDVLMEFIYCATFDENNRIKRRNDDFYELTGKVISYIKLSNGEYLIEANDRKVSKELHNQIAFLILKKQNLGSVNKQGYLQNLKKLNDIRNKLYLTHGDDVNEGFYGRTEQEKRENEEHNIQPEGDIKDLFELVAFLLTGEKLEIYISSQWD